MPSGSGSPPVPVAVEVQAATPGARQTAIPQLPAMRSRLGRLLYETRPWLVHERGWKAVGLTLGRDGPDATAAWSTELENSIRDLQAVAPENLPPAMRAEYESLLGWMQAEYVLVSMRGTTRRDPVAFVQRVDRTLRAVVVSDALGPMERAKEASLILNQLPAYWEDASRTLSQPAADWSLEAMQRLIELAYWMQRDLFDDLLISALPQKFQDIFKARLQLAVESTNGFHRWLAEGPARSGDPVQPLQAGMWEKMVVSLTGTELGMDGLKARLEKSVRDFDYGLDFPLLSVEAQRASMDPSAISAQVSAASLAAMRLAAEVDVAPRHLDAVTRLKVRIVEGRTMPGPVALGRFGSLGSNWLELEPNSFSWSLGVRDTRARLFSPGGQRTIAIRYGFPGEMLLRYETNSDLDRTRSLISNRATTEGWGLYTLDWLPRIDWVPNPLAKDQELARAFAYARLLEAVRLLASMELHLERLPEQEVVDHFIRRSGFDPDSANAEIDKALHDPMYGIGFLGYLEMLENERLLARSSAPGLALQTNARAILQHSNLRPVDMRRNLFPYVTSQSGGPPVAEKIPDRGGQGRDAATDKE